MSLTEVRPYNNGHCKEFNSERNSPTKRKLSDEERLSDFLQRVPLSKVQDPDQRLVCLEHNWSVSRGLLELAKHRILSAPLVITPDLEDVQDMPLRDPDANPTLVGWVDIPDILTALLQHLQRDNAELPGRMLQLMQLLEKEGPRFANKMLITIASKHDRELVQANAQTTMLDALREHFLGVKEDGSQHVVHRVAMFDNHGAITAIVSQLDIIRFLLQHCNELGTLGTKTLDDLGLLAGKCPVVTVSPHIPTLHAFRHMLEKGVSGAAVQSDGDDMIANLSISDLRCIQSEHFGTLALPVAEFLALVHNTSYAGYSANTSKASSHPFFAPPKSPSQRSMSIGSANGSRDDISLRRELSRRSSSMSGSRHELSRRSSNLSAGGHSPSRSPSASGRHMHAELEDAPELHRINSGLAGDEVKLITCTAGTTLCELLRLFVEERIHRVYVVKSECCKQAEAVITPTDIMRIVSGVW